MITVNGVDKAYEDLPIDDLLALEGIVAKGVAVAIDGEIVRRSQWSSVKVHDGCTVEIVTAAAGG